MPRIRPETPADHAAIAQLTRAAFLDHPHSQGTEPAIIDGLRAAGALALSLVIEDAGELLGHAAFSPVSLPGASGWVGLGPVSVAPGHQGQGHGAALIRAGLAEMASRGAAGCVVLGPPDYYRRLGFAPMAGLTLPGVPADHFMAQALAGPPVTGEVAYHPAFYI